MKKIYIVGSLNMDLVIETAMMPDAGMTVTGGGFMTNPGGKGANQAAAVGKLGGNAYMVGAVGESFGDDLVAALGRCSVSTEFVERRSGVSSGIAVIVVADGDNRIILDKGANDCLSFDTIDRALANASEGDFLVTQLEISQDTVRYALQKAKEKKMITLLNPAPAASIGEGILAYCDYFTPNQSETEFYTGIYPSDEETATAAAKALQKMGVANALITMGVSGSFALCGNECYRAEAFPVKALDTTAAGDTFVGGFVTILSEGASVPEAMRFAAKASSITVTRRGAQQSIPTRDEVIL